MTPLIEIKLQSSHEIGTQKTPLLLPRESLFDVRVSEKNLPRVTHTMKHQELTLCSPTAFAFKCLDKISRLELFVL